MRCGLDYHWTLRHSQVPDCNVLGLAPHPTKCGDRSPEKGAKFESLGYGWHVCFYVPRGMNSDISDFLNHIDVFYPLCNVLPITALFALSDSHAFSVS